MRRSVALVLVCAALAAACGDDADRPAAPGVPGPGPSVTAIAPGTTAAPVTTAPSTSAPSPAPTVGATTSLAPSTAAPSTVPPGTPLEWTRPCVETSAAPGSAAPPAADLGRFGPLGAEPAVHIEVPRLTTVDPRDSAPRVTTAVVPEGVVVAVAGGSTAPIGSSIMAGVGFDGAVRWVRCVTGQATIPSGTAGVRDGDAVVELWTADADRWLPVDPGDGSIGDAVEAPDFDSQLPIDPRVGFRSPDDDLVGTGDDGAELWRRSDLTSPGVQGSGIWVDGDTAVLQACTTPRVVGQCEIGLVGVDVATGATRWSIAGMRMVPAGAADGSAIVSGNLSDGSDPGWRLLDDRTGEPVPGQAWTDPGAFAALCCGDSEYFHVARTGGVVVVVAQDAVNVWLPAAAGGVTARVTVP